MHHLPSCGQLRFCSRQTRLLLSAISTTVLMVALMFSGAARAQDHAAHDHSVSTTSSAPLSPEHDPHSEHHDHASAPNTAMQTHDSTAIVAMPANAMPANATQADAMQATPVPTDAERAAAFPKVSAHAMHDNRLVSMLIVDHLETWSKNSQRGLRWDLQGWIGGDIDRVWLRSEGERRGSRTEAADIELLYGHSVSPWWDVLAGVRHDFTAGPAQDRLAIGAQGLAPYKFDVEATAYLGNDGRSSVRIQGEYELLLTNRLILQPKLEVQLSDRRDLRRHIGAGLSTAEIGLRLRYEISRRFAPYVGIVDERSFSGTAVLRSNSGEPTHETRIVGGLRFWF